MSTTEQSSGRTAEDVVTEFMGALARRDYTSMIPYLAEDATWTMMGCDSFLENGGRTEGKQKIIDGILALSSKIYQRDTYRMDVRNVIANDEYVAIEFMVNATNWKGRLYKDATYCTVFRVSDGLIAEVREYVDSYKVKTVNWD
jgi:ketosteroid isomerase-like protein